MRWGSRQAGNGPARAPAPTTAPTPWQCADTPCFSGGARNQELVMARGLKVVPKYDLLKGNIVSFSASSGNQSSYAYTSKNHGMFTYFLLKSIQEANGDITYGDMWEKVRNKVSFESVKINSKEQNPQKNVGVEVEKEWSKWKFKQ